MERINLVELLKDCIGMELDCTIFDDVTLYRIDTSPENEYPIRIETKSGNFLDLTKYGTYSNIEESKCVIFPKGKTTWERFQRPFMDGDILSYQCTGFRNRTIYIYRHHPTMNTSYYVALGGNLDFMVNRKEGCALCGNNTTARLATEKEKEKLFQAIRDNGYTWNSETKNLERFSVPKFKNGDILYCNANDHGENKDMFKYIFIFDKIVDGRFYYSHCHLFGNEFYDTEVNLVHDYSVRFATEDEKARLFDAIEDNGYKWNSETKTLEKLPKFKVGDRIRQKTDRWPSYRTIKSYDKNIGYFTTINDWVRIEDQDDWELVPNKFDINTLVPFESKVLVRNRHDSVWAPAFWGYYSKEYARSFVVAGGNTFEQCIPYEGNEHLLNSNKDCDEYYKTWRD